ncbi:hypothetical protein AMTR_s00045p00111040 [Amborella trichopoda]|uniref:Uncharacterized protein n=1 Tax=Amborella trichopoda TaxID=13333 RepID=W1NWK8_AMBTC|nr:hypothetical protein AMTR_s00045p00111040 [Amborella trichopoda]
MTACVLPKQLDTEEACSAPFQVNDPRSVGVTLRQSGGMRLKAMLARGSASGCLFSNTLRRLVMIEDMSDVEETTFHLKLSTMLEVQGLEEMDAHRGDVLVM